MENFDPVAEAIKIVKKKAGNEDPFPAFNNPLFDDLVIKYIKIEGEKFVSLDPNMDELLYTLSRFIPLLIKVGNNVELSARCFAMISLALGVMEMKYNISPDDIKIIEI